MSFPELSPLQNSSVTVLPASGSASEVAASLPFGVYADSSQFLSGAAAQVSYVYQKLSGPVVDIELTPGQVYAAYEEAVLEWSYLVNLFQTKNVLSNALGADTGSFDWKGEITSGTENLALLYPKYGVGFARRAAEAYAAEAGFGPQIKIYSASIPIEDAKQDYDLQAAIEADPELSASVGNKVVRIEKVYFKSAAGTWRFYGYYGGLNVVGNLSTYGQFADDSTFEVIPTFHNKLQAMAFEDALWTRTSHYSYQLRGNVIRLYPVPSSMALVNLWVEFSIPDDPWTETISGSNSGISGVNNLNNIPFANIPYSSINAMGKQLIRKYSLAVCKEMLANSRGKFLSVPIPNGEVTLNYAQLAEEAKAEKEQIREEIKDFLEQTTYENLAKADAETADAINKVLNNVPLPIYRK